MMLERIFSHEQRHLRQERKKILRGHMGVLRLARLRIAGNTGLSGKPNQRQQALTTLGVK